jgi:thioredoxin reductase
LATNFDYDVIIVGAGPAGLNAGLLLARARRTVLICDEGAQRNRFSQALHGFLTRDGVKPTEFLEMARKDFAQYESVEFQQCRVIDAERLGDGFRVIFEEECQPLTCRKLLLARRSRRRTIFRQKRFPLPVLRRLRIFE